MANCQTKCVRTLSFQLVIFSIDLIVYVSHSHFPFINLFQKLKNKFEKQSQFCADESITDLPPLLVDDESPEILPDGVRKLIHVLKNNKSPGPDQIRKCDLPVDTNITSKRLSLIDQMPLSNIIHDKFWKWSRGRFLTYVQSFKQMLSAPRHRLAAIIHTMR